MSAASEIFLKVSITPETKIKKKKKISFKICQMVISTMDPQNGLTAGV